MLDFFRRLWKFLFLGSKPKATAKPLQIGILGCAAIAPTALIIPASSLGNIKIQGIAARDETRANHFSKKYSIPLVFKSYEDLIDSTEIDAVYIPSPNGLHFKWAIECIRKGKHVLCEKPLVSNHDQALKLQKLVKGSDYKGKIFAEAFHWKAHPAALYFGSILRGEMEKEGWKLGVVRSVHTKFSIPSFITWDKKNIRFDFDLAGGVTMDAGTYAISSMRFVVENYLKKSGNQVKYTVQDANMTSHPNDKRIDMKMDSSLDADGIACRVEASFIDGILDFQSWIVVECDAGTLTFSNFISPYTWHRISLKKRDGTILKKQVYGDGGSTYFYQTRAFAGLVDRSVTSFEEAGITDIDDSVVQMKIIDDIYLKAGFPIRP